MIEETTRREGRGSAALWFGVLIGPLAWSAQLLTGAELPELLCAPASSGPDVGSIGVETILVSVTALCAALVVLGVLLSFRCWRRTRPGSDATQDRARWMALAGLLSNGLFLLIIVLGFLPTAFLDRCNTSL